MQLQLPPPLHFLAPGPAIFFFANCTSSLFDLNSPEKGELLLLFLAQHMRAKKEEERRRSGDKQNCVHMLQQLPMRD